MVEEKVCYRDVGAHSQRRGIGRVQSGRDIWRVREGRVDPQPEGKGTKGAVTKMSG